MDLLSFTANVGAALLMGLAIGLERQCRQHTAGLRTNTLVALGAVLLTLAVVLWVRRRRRPVPPAPLPPHTWALRELDRLGRRSS